MLGRTTGAVLLGVDARLVTVEVALGGGLPVMSAVGRPDIAVREGLDRIRAALRQSGFQLPQRRVTINLAPADLPKHGTGLDLPIAMAVLAADGQVPSTFGARIALLGELALDGGLRGVPGTLCVAMAVRREGITTLLVPIDAAAEAALVPGLEVVPLASLADAVAVARGDAVAPQAAIPDAPDRAHELARPRLDLADVAGQPSARRALEVAAAGGHHLLLIGPPGTGKTLLASRLPGILPEMERDEALAVTRVWSAAGLARGLVRTRPFRAPHHGTSAAALAGGGPALRPGEMSLAHHGILYLDELPEFRRDALEALRQPLEEQVIRVSRARATVVFPTAFQLVASMNPCPCGQVNSSGGRCRCTPGQVDRYQSRISGPLLDRFDLCVEVPPLDPAVLGAARGRSECSDAVRGRVEQAWARRQARTGNAWSGERLAGVLPLPPKARECLIAAARALGLSARGFDRVHRVAQTVADLAGAGSIGPEHVSEALHYRFVIGGGAADSRTARRGISNSDFRLTEALPSSYPY